ncbi:MAG: hypothetical protein ACTS5I_11005, partial [Rhodanobacter sp.]
CLLCQGIYKPARQPLTHALRSATVMDQIIAALILACGAYFGVYKGAVFAVHRLSAQLDEDRRLSEERLDAEARRLQMQLDAEADRLDTQLAHDRWMREVDELRRLIDESAAAGLTAGNAVHALRGPVRYEVSTGRVSKFYLGLSQEAKSSVQGMQGFVERLELRLGSGHDLPTGFSSWQLAVEEALEALETRPPTKEMLRAGGERLTTSSEKYRNFMEAARGYVRLEPPGDERVGAV